VKPLHARTPLLTTLLTSSLLLTACSSYSAPKLSLAEAKVTERTDQGLVLQFTLNGENSNEVPLPLRQARYSVYLDGKKVFTGYRSPEATLRRFGVQPLQLPAAFSLAQAPQGLSHFRIEGELSYVTPGEIAQILFDASVRRPTVGFSAQGTVDLNAPPSATQ
jgi:LEA14-like dessication related protein